MPLWRALTRSDAATAPDAEDPRLRGRTYPIPFARVWSEALATAGARRGWSVVSADARTGEIAAKVRTPMLRFAAEVRVRLLLDGDGQTRVDVTSASGPGLVPGDLGANTRRIARFLHALDRRLAGRR